MKLEKYQIEGAEFLAQNKHALLADDMGLGKTAQAINAAVSLYASHALVICPASVKYHWENEFNKWAIGITCDVAEGRKHNFNHHMHTYIVNYELLLSNHIFNQLKSIKWDVLICDEAHYLKKRRNSVSIPCHIESA